MQVVIFNYRGVDLKEALQWKDKRQPRDVWADRYYKKWEKIQQSNASLDRSMRFLELSDEKDKYQKELAKEKEQEERRSLKEKAEQAKKELKQKRRELVGLAVVFILLLIVAFLVFQEKKVSEAALQQQTQDYNALEKQKLEANYHLAKFYEEKAKHALSMANYSQDKVKNGHELNKADKHERINNYQAAWLYALEAQQLQIPVKKTALAEETLSGLLSIPKNKITPERIRISCPLREANVNSKKTPSHCASKKEKKNFVIAYHSASRASLAVGADDGKIRLWNIQSGKLIRTLKSMSAIHALAYDSSGQVLASALDDKTIRLWSVSSDSPSPIQTLTGHAEPVVMLAYSPNKDLLISVSYNSRLSISTVKVWRTESESVTLKKTFFVQEEILALVWNPTDSNEVAIASRGKAIRLWNIHSGERKMLFEHYNSEGSIRALAYSQDGKLLISGGDAGDIRSWSVASGKSERHIKGHISSVHSLSFSPDSGVFVSSASNDKNIRFWDAQSGESRGILRGHHDDVFDLVYGSDGTLLSTSDDHTVRLWDVKESGYFLPIRTANSDTLYAMSYSSNGKLLAYAAGDRFSGSGNVWLRNMRTGGTKKIFKEDNHLVYALAYHPEDNILAIASSDNVIQLWNIKTEKIVTKFKGHKDKIHALAFSSDGNTLVSASADTTIRLWDTQSSKLIHILKGHKARVLALAYRNDDMQIASASIDKTIRLWNSRSGKLVKELTGHEGSVLNLVYSPNGLVLASGSMDKTVRLWSSETGRQKRVFKGHYNAVSTLSYHPSGDILASGSWDKQIKLWDIHNREKQTPLETIARSGKVEALTYSPDGNVLAVGLNKADKGEIQALSQKSLDLNKSIFSPDSKVDISRLSTLLQQYLNVELEQKSLQFKQGNEFDGEKMVDDFYPLFHTSPNGGDTKLDQFLKVLMKGRS